MFLDDAFQNLRSGPAIPGALWIHHRNGPALTNPQAVGLGAIYLRETKLFQPTLQIIPALQPLFFGAALRLCLVAAKKNVPLQLRDLQTLGDTYEFIFRRHSGTPCPPSSQNSLCPAWSRPPAGLHLPRSHR